MKSKRSDFLIPAPRYSKQRGASLLEGIAYLGIAAMVILGAVSLLTGAFSSAKSNQTSEEVVALRTAVRKLYIGQPYPGASMLPSLIPAKAMPNTLVIDPVALTAKNTWGGVVSVDGDPVTGTFKITYNLVPEDVCVNIVSGANGWASIAGSTTITVMPPTAAQATGLCASPGGASLSFTAT